MQFTLKHLLESYKVMVPQIQRDYAQGRESEFELRKGFVTKIKQTIQENEPKLNLDFIYGYTEKAGKDVEVFIPLDGQQRLTTLWLTHWFLAPRIENKISEEAKAYLSKFTYETRVSSKRFCYNLIHQPLTIVNDITLSQQITDAPWFMASWSSDPTVLAMLNMLDTIQKEITEKSKAWENITVKEKITFDFIDIKSDEFKLTDELYIKMNSRGKPLTAFENFKAQFSTLLSSDKTDYLELKLDYEGTDITYQQYFAFKIDSKWMDLFWGYRNKLELKTDDCIYNYINFIAEFLFYKENPKTTSSEIKIDFDFLNDVFTIKKNIDFLFNSLDWLSGIEDLTTFFESLFEGLSVFDNGTRDYFYRAITNTDFDVKDKVIFYTILNYAIEFSVDSVDDELKDLTRIVRNLLFTVRQPNQIRRIEYTSNLRLTNVGDYCKFTDTIIDKKKQSKNTLFYKLLANSNFSGFAKNYVQKEMDKANFIIQNPKFKTSIQQLEEHIQIQGNTANFKLDSENFEIKIKAFLEIWSEKTPTNLIIRALLTIDDYTIQTHDNSALGSIWYFGSKNAWNRILTALTADVETPFADTLDSFLNTYLKTKGNSSTEKLETIINNYKSNSYDWFYYFIKYEPMSKNSQTLNVFTWNDDNGFNINSLGNSGNYPLHSYHLNPYLIAVNNLTGSNKNKEIYFGRFAELSCIRIKSTLDISVSNEGWEISPLGKYQIDSELIQKYKLKQDGDVFILKENSKKDKIEIAIDFINDILN
ncbi:MAG: DUF262 domain-containing protein [Bacteroidales bacterium]|nr:DUF262 domain-containing protein [Bacteroidales bacterium]